MVALFLLNCTVFKVVRIASKCFWYNLVKESSGNILLFFFQAVMDRNISFLAIEVLTELMSSCEIVFSSDFKGCRMDLQRFLWKIIHPCVL